MRPIGKPVLQITKPTPYKKKQQYNNRAASWVFGDQLLTPSSNSIDILLPQNPKLGEIHPSNHIHPVSGDLGPDSCRPQNGVNFSRHLHVTHQANPAVILHEIIDHPEDQAKPKPINFEFEKAKQKCENPKDSENISQWLTAL